jgi:hypothetical protein
MKKLLFFCLLIAAFVTSCTTPHYYTSPLNNTSQYYHSIPLRSDSVKSATYVNGIITLGSAESGLDNVYAFNGNISRSHNLKFIQAYYGIGLTVGDYIIQKLSTTTITIPPTDNSFGAYGFNGGINLVVPFGNKGSEWRIAGIETSIQNEFGNYLKFRRSNVDSKTIESNNWTTTIGGYSEIVWKLQKGYQFGYKLSCGESLAPANYGIHDIPVYLLNTFHFTRENATAFMQINAGTYAEGIQLGINYRISKKKRSIN